MDRLKRIGKIKAKASRDVVSSRLGVGFEKLDRDVFDPEKAYDPVAATGVKWVRIQSGWQRTEREKGVYDFRWLDDIVDNLMRRGLQPWICLCYGNGLYTESARAVFGAVGCPPIFSEEEKTAWRNYVKALVSRYAGKVQYYEVWNEPDGGCWKHGVNATELGEFTLDTAKTVKSADPSAKVIGGVLAKHHIRYLNEAFRTGMGAYLDAVSYHEYTSDETSAFETVSALKSLASRYNPKIEIIQGESGSQSRRGGNGALKKLAWTPQRQAKQLARHTLIDLLANVKFSSYFSTMDMIEALKGVTGDVSTYLDYGYFGILGAEFDENGKSIGTYAPKPSYYVLQNLASIFAEVGESVRLPVMFIPEPCEATRERDCTSFETVWGGFEKDGCYAFVYWKPENILTTEYSGTVTLEASCLGDELCLADVMDGTVYAIPEDMLERDGFGSVRIHHLPIRDTPLILMFGHDGKRFAEYE